MTQRSALKWLTGLLIFSVIIVIGPYIILNIPFEYGGDLKPSWFAFYSEMKNVISIRALLEHAQLPFYSWNLFLGNNFWASKGFYGLSDIFNYLTLWLPIHFYVVFNIQIILKTLIAGLAFFHFISKLSDNHQANLISSLAYAISSWFIYYIGQPTFASFYALLPLYFAGIEAYLTHKKKLLFIGASALLLFTNYYLFYSLSFFTVIYYSYRYYIINRSYKSFITDTLTLIFYYFVGALITAIITIPTALYMLNSDRVGGFWFNFYMYDYKIIYHQLISLFVPSHVFIYRDNLFETGLHTTREILLWSGSLSALLIPQVFFDKDKAFRKATLITYTLFILILVTPIGGSILHGFSETSFRWTFLLILFNLLISNRYLSKLEHLDRKGLTISFVFILLWLPFVLIRMLFLNGVYDQWIDSYRNLTLLFVFSISGISLVYATLMLKKTWAMKALVMITFIELSGYSYLNLVYNRMDTNITWEFTHRVTHVLQEYPNQLNNYLKNLKEGNALEFYRVFVPHESLYWSYSHNMNLHYQLQGLMTYDSTYSPSFNAMKRFAPQVKDFESNWIFNIRDPYLVDFLNTKYAIVLNENELPHADFTLVDDNYLWLRVYENNRYKSLARSYQKVMTYETFEARYGNDTSLLNDWIIAKPEDIDGIKKAMLGTDPVSLTGIYYYGNELHGFIESYEPNFMVLSLPYDAGWRITLNGDPVDVYEVSGGFMGFSVPAHGHMEFSMRFVPEGFNTGAIATIIGITLYLWLILNERSKQLSK